MLAYGAMRRDAILTPAAVLFFMALGAAIGAQPPAGRGGQSFPAQQRPLADAAAIERGGTLYGINCRLCHGPDLRGGDLGGVNLLRSQLVLNDQDGELIYPVVKNGRAT